MPYLDDSQKHAVDLRVRLLTDSAFVKDFVSRSSLLSLVIIEKVRIGIAQQALFESSLIEKVSQARDTQCITPLLRLPP